MVLVPAEPGRTRIHDVIYQVASILPSKGRPTKIIDELVAGPPGRHRGCTEIVIGRHCAVVPTARIHAETCDIRTESA